jgi:sec-independent protein translocase protein TatC
MRRSLSSIWSIITFPFRALWWLVNLPFMLGKRINKFLNEEPEESQLPDIFSTSIQKPSLFLEHLDVLRKHLLRILVILVLCVGILFIFTTDIVDFLATPIGGLDELVAIDVTESVGVFMRVALLGAAVLASPYIAFELWLFAAPGLLPRARKLGLLGIPFVLLFFLAGLFFTFKYLLPSALPFLLNFMGVEALPRISSYIKFVTGIMFWIGLAFEFPLVIFVLTMMGILQPRSVVKQWRIAIVIIAIAAAAITPTPDPINMSIVMIPLILLYIISIGFSYLAAFGRKQRKESNE